VGSAPAKNQDWFYDFIEPSLVSDEDRSFFLTNSSVSTEIFDAQGTALAPRSEEVQFVDQHIWPDMREPHTGILSNVSNVGSVGLGSDSRFLLSSAVVNGFNTIQNSGLEPEGVSIHSEMTSTPCSSQSPGPYVYIPPSIETTPGTWPNKRRLYPLPRTISCPHCQETFTSVLRLK
jgi:hypothetical protein